MTRNELLLLRNNLQALVKERRGLGDYDTNAAAIRAALEASLALAEHLLSQAKA